jgi:hypothetical protein
MRQTRASETQIAQREGKETISFPGDLRQRTRIHTGRLASYHDFYRQIAHRSDQMREVESITRWRRNNRKHSVVGWAGAGVGAAIANAVFHATGVRVRELPIRPEHLLL